MSRRAHGDGSVFFDEHRGKWVGTVELAPSPDGKRRRRKVVGATPGEVSKRLRKLSDDADAGVDLDANRMTVAELLDRWEAVAMPARQVSEPTRDKYRWAIHKHLRPRLGRHKLSDLRAEHVEAMFADLAASGMARASAIQIRTTLGLALRWAEARDYVLRNVARLADLPADLGDGRPARALNREEATALLASVAGTRLEALWLCTLALGLRPGEVAGLTWDDVDLKARHLHVRRSMKYRNDEPLGLGEVKTGNTGRGRRTLVMPRDVVAAFRRHRAAQRLERLALGPWPSEWADLVFVSEVGTPLRPRNLRRTLDELATKAKIGHLTRYDLRHSAATLLAAMGVPLEDVADLLGHETTRMARAVYVHAQGRPIGVAAPLAEVLGA